MTAPSTEQSYRLQVALEQGSDEQLDQILRALSWELHELGMAPSRPDDDAPSAPGAKGDVFTLGALALVTAPVVLPKLLDYLRDWCVRANSSDVRSVTLSAKVGGKTVTLEFPADARPDAKAVDAFLDAVNGRRAKR